MKRITVAAPAKVNLTLHIPARLENGYHAVEMVMQTVTLFDRVTVEEAQGLHIAADMPLTENEADNTAHRAATLFADARKLREAGPAAPEKGGAQRPSISIVYDYGDESHSPDAPGTV